MSAEKFNHCLLLVLYEFGFIECVHFLSKFMTIKNAFYQCVRPLGLHNTGRRSESAGSTEKGSCQGNTYLLFTQDIPANEFSFLYYLILVKLILYFVVKQTKLSIYFTVKGKTRPKLGNSFR